MTEPKFKPGMRVFHVTQGVMKLEEGAHAMWPLKVLIPGCALYFTENGFQDIKDKFPTIYTLERAREMGFPVPAEPLRVECRVRWAKQDGVAFPYSSNFDEWENLIGKTGVLTFVESEVGQ